MSFSRPINVQPSLGLARACVYCMGLVWILSSCSSQPQQPATAQTDVTATSAASEISTQKFSISELLALAEQSTSPQMERYLLDATARLIARSDFSEAQSLHERIIPETLPDQLKIRYGLVSAQLSLAKSNPAQALSLLAELERQSYININLNEQITLAQIRAQSYEAQQHYLKSAQELIFVEPLIQDLGEQSYQNNNQSIWRALMNTSLAALQEGLATTRDAETKGWLELAVISKNLDLGIDQQVSLLQRWQTKNPYHPLTHALPEEVKVLTEIKQSPIQNIALLLPLQHELSGAGQAVLNGFMSRVYRGKAQRNKQPIVRIYDTSETSHIATLYWQAIDEGAELVIGPLKQENVEQLADIDLPVPVLSLNYIRGSNIHGSSIRDSGFPTNALYQFGLASEDSARMAARQAWNAEHKKAIIIHPKGDWGLRNATAFSDEFAKLGGEVLSLQPFDNPKKYASIIQKTLHVSNSKNRIRQVNRILEQRSVSQTRRRKDVELIFLVALAAQGRQIKPLLDYYYADDLPIYSISNIYSGEPNKDKDIDLDRIIFNETPWLAENHTSSKRQIKNNWPRSFSLYPRLYALGADAYRIYPRLKQLELLPLNGMYAFTGYLKLLSSGKIQRTLKPVRFKNGTLRALPPLASSDFEAH
ncbi:MAG: penicillin-binding protein activator [Pseudomonadales bacterium]|nr:penicillin-binding protein activator [Pseudomonadales bacterium]